MNAADPFAMSDDDESLPPARSGRTAASKASAKAPVQVVGSGGRGGDLNSRTNGAKSIEAPIRQAGGGHRQDMHPHKVMHALVRISAALA